MWPTRRELTEWMQESSDDTPRKLREKDDGSSLQSNTEDTSQDISSDNVAILEELIYPMETTLEMLRQFDAPMFQAHVNLMPIMRKLLRSCRYWREPIPNWLYIYVGAGN